MFIKRFLITVLLVAMATAASARPVSVGEAQKAARFYLGMTVSNAVAGDNLAALPPMVDEAGRPVLYIFNIGDRGFIIMSAHTFAPPVIGYSLEGRYERDSLPPALLEYAEGYRRDIALAAVEGGVDENTVARHMAEWEALLQGDKGYYAKRGTKGCEQLLRTQWNQSAGYNDMCPMDSSGKHAVTGCVATAMAQIIRYHSYPEKGFGTSSYAHMQYGRLTAVHDSVTYDYSNMPNTVSSSSPAVQKNAVSLLCLHCGIAVHMNYQGTWNTSGSGAYVTDVPGYIQHFGYFRSYFRYKTDMGDSLWHVMLRHELDQRRPILYQGHSAEGGHAFVCDGYHENDYTYHFNWGWGGHGDGFYTLTTMREFTSSQGGVFGIYPSGLKPGHDTIYVQPGSYNGDGSSWIYANNDPVSAIRARGIYKSGEVWIRQGVYIGDTIINDRGAFTIESGVKVYGGFAGTETSIEERRPLQHPTFFDGRGKQRVVHTTALSRAAKLNGVQIINGAANDGAGIMACNNLTVENCTISYCQGAGGAGVYLQNTTMRNCVLHNNSGSEALYVSRSSAKKIIIANNNGGGCRVSDGSITGCDIVSNSRAGVVLQSNALMHNCIVWNNDSNLCGGYSPDSVRFNAIGNCDRSLAAQGNKSLGDDNNADDGPRFVYATPRGPHTLMGDWHLTPASPCIDAGDTSLSGSYTSDLDGEPRSARNRLDIGCYEYRSNVSSIASADEADDVTVYPNPTNALLHLTNTQGSLVTLYSMQGAKLMEAVGATVVDMSQLPAGCYIIRVGQSFHKVVKSL